MSLDQLMKVHSTRRSDRLWPIEAFTDAVENEKRQATEGGTEGEGK